MLLTGMFVFHLLYARVRAENGMSFMGLPMSVRDILLQPLGTAFYRPSEVVAIISTRWTYRVGWGEGTDAMVGAAFDSYKIADSAEIGLRRLTYALIGAFFFCLAFGVPLILWVSHRYGIENLHNFGGGWFHNSVRDGGEEAFTAVANPAGPDGNAIIGMGAGAGMAVFLHAMRLRFWWWPFHPVGYLMANAWGLQWWYMPFFVGWLVKTLVVRYGGLRLYQRTVPIAVGAIVGDVLVGNLWSVLQLLVRG
jgi:hypothetical protein